MIRPSTPVALIAALFITMCSASAFAQQTCPSGSIPLSSGKITDSFYKKIAGKSCMIVAAKPIPSAKGPCQVGHMRVNGRAFRDTRLYVSAFKGKTAGKGQSQYGCARFVRPRLFKCKKGISFKAHYFRGAMRKRAEKMSQGGAGLCAEIVKPRSTSGAVCPGGGFRFVKKSELVGQQQRQLGTHNTVKVKGEPRTCIRLSKPVPRYSGGRA